MKLAKDGAVLLLLAEGFEEVEALAPVDILRRGGVSVKTVGVTGRTVRGSHGIPVEADLSIEELEGNGPIRMLILPGGLPGADHLYRSAAVAALLEQTKTDGGHLAAICAAPYILGLHGLLEGKRATVYPSDTFRERMTGAILEDAGVVTDGNVTTGAAMGYAIPFALELLRLLAGEEKAKEVGASFLHSAG